MLRQSFSFSDKEHAEFERLKALLDRSGSQTVVSAIRFTLMILEKEREGHTICLKKGDEVTQLQIFF